MATKTIVGIKKLWYAEPITGNEFTAKTLSAIFFNKEYKEISNVHGNTWVYEEAEPSTTDYINQLTGKVYYRDSVPGAVQINFSIGQYDYETKKELQGGEADESSWTRSGSGEPIYKMIIAKTKDDTYIAFPNAAIIARGGMVEDKVLGLMLSAVAMETGHPDAPSEMWVDLESIYTNLWDR